MFALRLVVFAQSIVSPAISVGKASELLAMCTAGRKLAKDLRIGSRVKPHMAQVAANCLGATSTCGANMDALITAATRMSAAVECAALT